MTITKHRWGDNQTVVLRNKGVAELFIPYETISYGFLDRCEDELKELGLTVETFKSMSYSEPYITPELLAECDKLIDYYKKAIL